jgi:dihydrofolate reductase
VMTRTLAELPWQNSVRLSSVDEVAAVCSSLDGDLVVLGSGELVASLGTLVDRYVLSINPIALGAGRRLVLPATSFELVSAVPTTTGVIIATYARTTS